VRKQKPKVGGGEHELAFYYPGPVWHSGDWIKNLILFFDGVALLVPNYIKDKPDIVDPAIAAGLRKEGLLHILEPEKIVDKAATQRLATAMSEITTPAYWTLSRRQIQTFMNFLFRVWVVTVTSIWPVRFLNL
jgi:hypothetical protein